MAASRCKVEASMLPSPSSEDLQRVAASLNIKWQCALCLDTQPVVALSPGALAHVESLARLQAYVSACQAARCIPRHPPRALPLPDSTHSMDQQICRTCLSRGAILTSNTYSPFSGIFDLAVQLIATNHLNDPHDLNRSRLLLSTRGFHCDDDISSALFSNFLALGPKTESGEQLHKSAISDSSPDSSVHRQLPISVIAYSHGMLAHAHVSLRGSNIIADESSARVANVDNFSSASVPVQTSHPERPDRLRAAVATLVVSDLWSSFAQIFPREATNDELYFAADDEQLVALHNFLEHATPSPRIGDLYLMSQSLRSAREALAAVIDVADAVMRGLARNGLALVRPPGHHADCCHSRGFCVFNNVGAAARMLVSKGISKVLIVDWDVHHGNGTENMFYSDANVLCISIHRYDDGSFYPRSGHPSSCGQGSGVGYNINVALDGKGYGDADYMLIFDKIVMPVACSFNPEIVLVSCGFDAGKGDPIGEFNVTASGYALMTQRLLSLANGRVIVVLEGGYNLLILGSGCESIARVLLDPSQASIGLDSEHNSVQCGTLSAIEEVRKYHTRHWPCLSL